MLYTFYYLKCELKSAADLGYIPSMAREYRRLFNTVNDLYLMMRKAAYEQQESTWQEPVTEKAVGSLVGRFSVLWEDVFQYFPWLELTPDEETNALNKLLGLVEKLKNILKDITDQKTGAFQELKTFTEKDLTEPVSLMDRLDEYADELDIPEPIPWYISGEILEIKENTLRVLIERSGEEDKKREIPKKDFPEDNPQVGQLFFAKIDKERPDVVYGIDPLPPDDRTFDEVFIELFGKKIYDIVSARWEKQAS